MHISNCSDLLLSDALPHPMELHLKLESGQRMGSFKLRGIANQMEIRTRGRKETHFVTMSAGKRTIPM